MQIGVFGNCDSWYVRQLCDSGQSRGHQVFPLLFEHITAHVCGQSIQLSCDAIDLTQLDAILVRTMPPGTLEQVVTRMNQLGILEQAGIAVINSPRSLECAVDKYLTTQRLAIAGIPVPETVVCETTESAFQAFEQLGSDIVVKPMFGAEGRGILHLTDPELALRAFRTLERLGCVLYLQRFLHGPGFDVRVLLLDGQPIGSMKRTPRPGDFRANISQQGTGTPHSVSDMELDLSRRAASVTGCSFAGVDIMYDQDGQPLVIEVNAVPGWRGLQSVCHIDVPARLFRWLETAPFAARG